MKFNTTSLAVGAVVILAIFCTGEVVGVTCPENYINIHEKCLLFPAEYREWGSANDFCNAYGGELATHLDDCPFYEELLVYIESHSNLRNGYFWVGGSDQDLEGVWKWTNGDLINMGSLYWGEDKSGTHEPSGGTGENCVRFDPEGRRHLFHDDTCSDGNSFICQAQPIVKD